MEIIDRRGIPHGEDKSILNIPIGTVFQAAMPGYKGPYLRTYSHVCSLAEPQYTWVEGSAVVFRNYVPVKATLTVEDYK